MSVLSPYRKAIVPAVVAGVLWVLNHFGVVETMTVGDAVKFLATSVVVFFVPNEAS